MKEFTKYLKDEMRKDSYTITHTNNSKSRNRTIKSNIQSCVDKQHYYYNKWSDFYCKADTRTQTRICVDMLAFILNECHNKILYYRGLLND